MRSLLCLTIALLSASAHGEWCLPSVLALSAKPIGNMHPAKSADRPALLDAPVAVGFGAMWWCADGKEWEYHATPGMLIELGGTLRKAQAAYVADPAGVRVKGGARPSCFGKDKTAVKPCYPVATRPGSYVCNSTLIVDKDEQQLCDYMIRQAAVEWPK